MSIANRNAFPLDPRGCADAEAYGVSGLTKREFFAIEMMKANRIAAGVNITSSTVVRHSIQDADALIAELEKQE